MAHLAKYTASSSGHLFNHYGREGNVARGNENIDPERTSLNYNLAPDRESTQLEYLKQRLSEVHVLKRSDINVMCDWVVTQPKDLPEERSKEFFQATYDFLEQKYGKENIISAYVHRDETTDHMHFAFVPVVYDEKKDRYKVSAKQCVTRTDLKTFHTDLEAHVSERLGIEVNILNGATKEGNVTVPQLKAQIEHAEVLAAQNAEAEKKLAEYSEPMADLREINEIDERAKKTKIPPTIKHVPKDYDKVIGQARHAASADMKIKELQNELRRERQTSERLRKQNENLTKENRKLEAENKELNAIQKIVAEFLKIFNFGKLFEDFKEKLRLEKMNAKRDRMLEHSLEIERKKAEQAKLEL